MGLNVLENRIAHLELVHCASEVLSPTNNVQYTDTNDVRLATSPGCGSLRGTDSIVQVPSAQQYGISCCTATGCLNLTDLLTFSCQAP
jgi:hypothetical protein